MQLVGPKDGTSVYTEWGPGSPKRKSMMISLMQAHLTVRPSLPPQNRSIL